MARLSVNLNKVALLRNSRHTGVPDLLAFARAVIAAGAAGITVHPRPDERHIRRSDVPALARLLAATPRIELNVEGFPDARLLDIVRRDPTRAMHAGAGRGRCLHLGQGVGPRRRAGSDGRAGDRRAQGTGRTSDPVRRSRSRRRGAGRAGGRRRDRDLHRRLCRGVPDRRRARGVAGRLRGNRRRARDAGLVVNAGHDLNLRNIPPLVARIRFLAEASIGHELTADALMMGFPNAVAAYAAALRGAGA